MSKYQVVKISSCLKYGSSPTTRTRPLLFSLKIQEFYQKFSHIFPNLGLYSKISNVHHIKINDFFKIQVCKKLFLKFKKKSSWPKNRLSNYGKTSS